ncbi:MAG: type VI secretion system contractile sheath large subunit [Nitrospira sp.]|nr:type VI secretion system contractile sheath large subunit [Nitrospira sp.]
MNEQATETQVTEFNEEAFPKLSGMIKETQPDPPVIGGVEEQIREMGVLVDEAMEGVVRIKKNLRLTIQDRIAALDALISTQLSAILHAPEFQQLEKTWRGLHYLVKNSLTGEQLRIRVLNATKEELGKDFARASRFDDSTLWKMIYTREYDMPGGIPYSVLLGDFEFGPGSADMELLGHISQVAAGSFAPFIAAASPQFFGQTSHADLGNVKDYKLHFTQPQFARWRALRLREEARFLGLTLPHVLMREPYGPEAKKVDEFNFKEDVTGRDHRKYLWGNPCFAIGVRLTEAFALYGWPVACRGIEGGGAVLDLPLHTFETDEGMQEMKCPTEVAIPGTMEGSLSAQGFIPLCHVQHENYAAFFGAQSCQQLLDYSDPAARANADLSTKLPYILAVSRIAHHLNCIARDKIGGFLSRQDCENFLNRWIRDYVLPDDTAPAWRKAKQPLREAKIIVKDIPGAPGRYSAEVLMSPHVQFEALSAQLSLVAELPKEAK